VFRQKILPLLQEYFYGDWHKIQLVLGDLIGDEDADYRPKAHPQAIVLHVVQRPKRLFGVEDEAYQDRRSYMINEDLSAESFVKIYQSLSRE
jgi:5-methylcytosine-specific restriction protein B